MIAKKRFIQSGILLAGVALWMRTASLLFNAYVTQKVGAEGMGLLSLTMSVYAFAVTFATSGVSLAVTRQLAAYFGSGEGEKAKRFMTAATLYACVFGSIASVFLYFGAGYIATELLGDLRTASSLRLLSVSLVPIALSSVYSGYFSAVRRVWHNAATQIAEQFFRMSLTVLGLSFLLPKGLEYACLSLVGGSSLSELLSFLILLVQTKRDMRKNPFPEKQIGKKVSLRQEFRTVLANALPCALSAHARSGLLTIEHLLIPKCLKAFGMGRSKALSSYASLHGMAIPVVLFPLAVLTPFTGLFIPEFAELEEKKNKKTIGKLAQKAMSSASVFS
ncbi:MAG: oligosaccharide flippase family protein, partial [Clostridia bacterium]|nr:oligosaccharide flippase family protein [Clostridia bacterium]